MKLGKKAVTIVAGAIIGVGISLFLTSQTLTTAFIMGISLTILGVAMILLARHEAMKTAG
jgi:uncharacterized membrane-anchored protein YitT (DUF2179 family)